MPGTTSAQGVKIAPVKIAKTQSAPRKSSANKTPKAAPKAAKANTPNPANTKGSKIDVTA